MAPGQPLKPEVKLHLFAVRFTELFYSGRLYRLVRLRPGWPAPALLILFRLIRMQRVECRLPVKALAFTGDKVTKLRHLRIVASGKARPRHPQRRDFQRGNGSVIHPLRIARLSQLLLCGGHCHHA